MADATIQISGLETAPAPLDYDVPPAQSFDLLAVRAVFDGTGAAGAFLPCVQIHSSSGNLMAQSVGSSVAAGADADVTFAPFLRSLGTSTAAGGIKYDTDPQTGGYLVVSTTGANGAGKGMIFHATGANPLELLSQSLLLYAENQGFALGTIEIVNLGDDRLLIQAAGTGDVTVQADPGGVELRSSSLVFVNLTQAGSMMQVIDHTGAPIFEVREDGSVHILTGTTVVADL